MEKKSLKNSIWIRLGIVGLLTLLLLIPATMIMSLIQERQQRYKDVSKGIASKWGDEQTLSGPVLSVPYKVTTEYEVGKFKESTYYLHILPEELNISAEVTPHIRYRGIYEIVVYSASVQITGQFIPGEIDLMGLPNESLMWDEAFIYFGISDMKGIKNLAELEWNGTRLALDPGIPNWDVLKSGISKRLHSVSPAQKYEFALDLDLNGSRSLYFSPLGKTTDVTMTSSWTEPSFAGNFLPKERKVDTNGFTAQWQIFHLNRTFPQKWVGHKHLVEDSKFGVKLIVPVNEYQKTMRTAKYALLIISLTFLSFFMIELLNKAAIHPIQYLLTGAALVIFYSLLLAFSEHLGFGLAYLISSIATIALIVIYIKSVLKNIKQTSIVGGILVLLYSYMYFILQLQDYALMVGSIGLFIILASIMYLTRKTNWSEGMGM